MGKQFSDICLVMAITTILQFTCSWFSSHSKRKTCMTSLFDLICKLITSASNLSSNKWAFVKYLGKGSTKA